HFFGERYETSPEEISASGRQRCHADIRIADRERATLSLAAGTLDCPVCSRWWHRRDGAPPQPTTVGPVRSTIHCREPSGCWRQYRYRGGRAFAARWLHAADDAYTECGKRHTI